MGGGGWKCLSRAWLQKNKTAIWVPPLTTLRSAFAHLLTIFVRLIQPVINNNYNKGQSGDLFRSCGQTAIQQ